jgi:signal transduction histidine kinase
MMRSLRFRLAFGALVAIAVAVTLAWLFLSRLFTDYVVDQYAGEMSALADTLAARVAVENGRLLLAGDLPDPRLSLPAGGRYWQISIDDGEPPLRSRSLWDVELNPASFAKSPFAGFLEAEGPDGSPVLVASRPMTLGDGAAKKAFVVHTAFSRSDLDAALESYHRPMRRMLLTMGCVLLMAAFLQGWIGLSPLRRLRDRVADIRAGRSAKIDVEGPSEVRPLVSELNLLLSERETAVARARARASDLAHGLKTPLTVLSHLVENLPPEKRSAALQQIELVRQRADRQLQAARMGVERMTTTVALSLAKKLVDVLKPFTVEKGVEWHVDIASDLVIEADPADVAEALGNILDNAARFARSRVELTAEGSRNGILLKVADDGPGADPQDYDLLQKRGSRMNEDSEGSGLGLAISGDIVEAYGGRLDLSASGLGGLEVTLTFPARQRERFLTSMS